MNPTATFSKGPPCLPLLELSSDSSSGLKLLVCDRSISVNVIMNKFVGLKCLTETKIQIVYGHVDRTRFRNVEMGCQMVQLLSANIVGSTMFVNLAPA